VECRIVQVEQGSDEWLDLRRTRITASCLRKVMAKKDTKAYTKYRQEIVLELLGNKNVEETPEWAREGREMEPKALAGYQWRFEQPVEHDLFLIHKKYDWLAASPDFMHMPEYDEGGEMKIRKLYKNYRTTVANCEQYKGEPRCIPAADRHQVQGAMWLTGYAFWWYVNYYIGDDLEGGQVQKIHRIPVPRDQAFIERMEERCIEFMKECYERAELEYESR
jgi:hypothetical protein